MENKRFLPPRGKRTRIFACKGEKRKRVPFPRAKKGGEKEEAIIPRGPLRFRLSFSARLVPLKGGKCQNEKCPSPLLLSVLPLSLLLREKREGEFSSPFEYQSPPWNSDRLKTKFTFNSRRSYNIDGIFNVACRGKAAPRTVKGIIRSYRAIISDYFRS